MRLVKFRIWNYKSIQDSGDCYFSGDDLTILAGKNEAGKTSILEALEDFDTSRQIRASAVPIDVDDVEPVIALTVRLHEDELAYISQELQLQSPTKPPDEITLLKAYPDALSIDSATQSWLSFVATETGVSVQPDQFVEQLTPYLPAFILFSSFTDVFPNGVSLAELATNTWISDLAAISDLNINIVMSGTDRQRVEHRNKLNISLNDDFRRFWEQDLSRLYVDWDKQQLMFWIQENDRFYEPEIRSQGRRWHLAFYIRVTARAKDRRLHVILIDEPGLYLHAVAQRDILKKLEDAAADAFVMFSTHSPYLVQTDHLERIRLVEKDETRGTMIQNKIHKVADKETLTPILTAIGLEMTSSIADLDRRNNVVVEGMSDYYYFHAFKQILSLDNISFVFGGGSGNMQKVGTILEGWGCNVVYCYDNDSGYKSAMKHVRAEWATVTESMIMKLPTPGSAVEDILSQADYKRYILDDPANRSTSKNSEYAKNSRRDKVLDAKNFRELVSQGSIALDQESMANIRQVVTEMRGKFEQ